MLRRSDGLMPGQKMICQLVVTTIFVVYIWVMDSSCLELLIPFTDGYVLSGQWVKILATPLCYFVVIGTVNGVNFTDGLDGLATGVTSMVAVFFTVASIVLGGEIEPITAAVLGALLGFCCLMSTPRRYLWGIRVPWPWEALWPDPPI